MRPVNLIPAEQRKRGYATQKSGVATYLAIGGLVAILAGVTAFVMTGNTITERKAEIERLEGEKQAATARADSLRAFADFAATEQARTATITNLATSRFDWERVLRELALVIPPTVTLKALTGSASPDVSLENSADVPLRDEIPGPALSLTGCASGQTGVAEFVAAVGDIDGVTRVGLSDSVNDGGDGSGETDCFGGTSFSMVAAFDEATTGAAPAPEATAPPAETAPAVNQTAGG
jgi:Tfp pilus assembly protein PilN